MWAESFHPSAPCLSHPQYTSKPCCCLLNISSISPLPTWRQVIIHVLLLRGHCCLAARMILLRCQIKLAQNHSPVPVSPWTPGHCAAPPLIFCVLPFSPLLSPALRSGRWVGSPTSQPPGLPLSSFRSFSMSKSAGLSSMITYTPSQPSPPLEVAIACSLFILSDDLSHQTGKFYEHRAFWVSFIIFSCNTLKRTWHEICTQLLVVGDVCLSQLLNGSLSVLLFKRFPEGGKLSLKKGLII